MVKTLQFIRPFFILCLIIGCVCCFYGCGTDTDIDVDTDTTTADTVKTEVAKIYAITRRKWAADIKVFVPQHPQNITFLNVLYTQNNGAKYKKVPFDWEHNKGTAVLHLTFTTSEETGRTHNDGAIFTYYSRFYKPYDIMFTVDWGTGRKIIEKTLKPFEHIETEMESPPPRWYF